MTKIHSICPVTPGKKRTLGSETSQYQEEKKKMKYLKHWPEVYPPLAGSIEADVLDVSHSPSSGERKGISPNLEYLC